MKINRTELKKALDTVKPGLANKEIIEQTTSFAFVDGKVVTYNDEICISQPLPDIEVHGAIKAEELYNFLGKVKIDEIDIEQTENEILMKAGRAKVGFAVNKEIVMPLDEEISETGDWHGLPEKFNESVRFAVSCTSKDMSNPKLTCVHLNNKIVESTDNYRVVRCNLNEELPFESTLIPATSLKEVLKLKPVMVSQGNGWLHFKNENETMISCRVFNERFVNTEGILKIGNDGLLFTFPEGVLEILEKAEVFTQSQAKQTNEENIDVSFDGRFLRIKCESETAWFKESAIVKGFKGEQFEFKITPYLLHDILKQTNTCLIMKNMLKFEGEDWIYISTLRGE